MVRGEVVRVLIVGAGLFGSTVAERLVSAGHKAVVIDKRNHIGGNCHSFFDNEVLTHAYGVHILHTSDIGVWDYVNRFAEWGVYTNPVLTLVNGEYYQFPINLDTINRFYQHKFTPSEAVAFIEGEREKIREPKNAEESALNLVGRKMYEAFFKGYTEKQWGCPATELPPETIKRIPIRFDYQWGYYKRIWQGLPIGGYEPMFERMLSGCDVRLETDYFNFDSSGYDLTVYTGEVDRFFDYKYGALKYRSLRWEVKQYPVKDYQGIGVINYPSKDVPYTRSIEYGCMHGNPNKHTKVYYEYPCEGEAYYPVNSPEDKELLAKYQGIPTDVIFGGRLGEYRYYDMGDTVRSALKLSESLI